MISFYRDFVINKTTGVIKTRNILDYETNPVITLNVKAQDNGVPQKYSYAQVDVYVQDTNDNAPHFDQLLYHGLLFWIFESSNAVVFNPKSFG